MHSPVPSTIAQILFEASSSLNYARIVAELEQVLARLKPGQLTTSWDCDDLVFFDMVETRIALAYAEFPGAQVASCLTVSVGPQPGLARPAEDPGFDVLCSRIVEKLQSRFVPMAILWHQSNLPISADLIDAMIDALPAPDKILPAIDNLLEPLWQTAQAAEEAQGGARLVGRLAERPAAETETALAGPQPPAPAQAPASASVRPVVVLTRRKAAAANDMPAASLPRADDLGRLRAALYPEEPIALDAAPMSTQMRLAVHAMNATLVLVWMPLGAAVMTYSILKGEDMRLSGRLMALTGTLLAFAHSPFGQSVAAAVAGTLS